MSVTNDFLDGISHITKGFGFLASRPRLWPWAILPTVINLILLGVMLGAFIHYYGDMYGWLSSHLGHLDIENPTAWYWHTLDALLWVLDMLFQVLIVLVSLILLLIISYAIALIIAAPFNDALSERVEVLVTGVEPPPLSIKKFITDIWRIIKVESAKAVILLIIPVALFVLNFIPVIGGALYIVLTCLFGAWDMGFAFADLPMGRKVVPLRERWEFAKKNKWALMGLGSGFVVPFFGLIFAAPLVVGGTLLYIDRSQGR